MQVTCQRTNTPITAHSYLIYRQHRCSATTSDATATLWLHILNHRELNRILSCGNEEEMDETASTFFADPNLYYGEGDDSFGPNPSKEVEVVIFILDFL
ncbi:hypothetical protein [Psychrobacillus sp. OK032]|uniref:hypothetical protein n=1 Tax=Psychrobacillus sp. OK032 TaxID=1884358 RepID=UPI0011602B53|nr:hypothetical protein [Psychrobacillus sp. OK032]